MQISFKKLHLLMIAMLAKTEKADLDKPIDLLDLLDLVIDIIMHLNLDCL